MSARREAFQRDGFVVIEGALAKALREVRDELDELDFRSIDGSSTRWDSSDRRVVKVPQLAQRRDVFRRLAQSDEIASVLEELIGPARVFRDVLIEKPAGDGSSFRDHQDIAYWDVKPHDLVVSAWMALDDAPLTSGCLEVVPGSHVELVPHRLVAGRFVVPQVVTRLLRAAASLTGTGDSPRTERQRRFARLKKFAFGTATRMIPAIGDLNDLHIDPATVPERTPVPVRAGDVIFFSSLTVHASGSNTGPTRRRAYIVSYMSERCSVPGSAPSDFLPARAV